MRRGYPRPYPPGPAFVFVAYIASDLLIRVPLLATMCDTFGLAPMPVPVPATVERRPG